MPAQRRECIGTARRHKGLTLTVAKTLAAAAEEEAVKNTWNVVIVMVDDGGPLRSLQRLDDTMTGSIEIVIQQAQTAVTCTRPSKALEEALVTKHRTPILTLPGAMPVEGGVPIVVNETVMGAIGVSGVTARTRWQKSWGRKRGVSPRVGQQCTGAWLAPQEVA
jgi:glc operon protein GlcG